MYRDGSAPCRADRSAVNNAGYAQGGALEENTASSAQAQFDTNVFGALRLINAVLPIMRHQGSGQNHQCQLTAWVVALPYLSLYSSSKFALEGLNGRATQ